jgi:hypothetical protein
LIGPAIYFRLHKRGPDRRARDSALRHRSEHVRFVERWRSIGSRHHSHALSDNGSRRLSRNRCEARRRRNRAALIRHCGFGHCLAAKCIMNSTPQTVQRF